MDSRKVIVLVLALVAIAWRFLTWTSFDNIGYIGIAESNQAVITHVSLNSPAEKSGLLVGDKILSVKSLITGQRLKPNQSIEYIVKRNSEQKVVYLKTSKKDYTPTKILGIMGVFILGIGVFIYYSYKNIPSFVFFLYCFVMSIHWGSYPQLISNDSQNIILSMYTLFSIFLGSVILHLSIIYPKSQVLSLKKYFAIYAPGIIGIFFFIVIFFDTDLLSSFRIVELILVSLFAVTGYIFFFRTYFKTPSDTRSSIGINIICLGILIANLPYILSLFLPFMDIGGKYGSLVYQALFVIESISFAYGINRISKNKPHLEFDDPI